MNHRYSLGMLAVLTLLIMCGSQISALAGESSDKSNDDIASTLKHRHAIGKSLKIFKPIRGKYQQTIKWWRKPGAKPSVDKSMSDAEWLFGGRFQTHKVKGQWLGFDFEGLATIGHDNGTEDYVLTWVDSFHSGIFQARGKYEKSSKTLTLHGSYFDVVTDQDRSIQIVMTISGKKGDAHVTIFDVSASGEPVKFLEFESKRFVPRAA